MTQFQSAPRRILLTPGPTNTSASVRAALAGDDVCHKESRFCEMVLSVNARIVSLLDGGEQHGSAILTCSGTGANEAMLNSIRGFPLVLVNGRYGKRLVEILHKYQVEHHQLAFDDHHPLNPNDLETFLRSTDRVTHIVCVHHETERGVLNPLNAIGAIASQFSLPLLVDGISAIGGHEFSLTKDNVSLCTVSANKCLEGVPGVAFVCGKRSVFESLKGIARSYYLDIYEHWHYQKNGSSRFTPATNTIAALHEALLLLAEEGYQPRVDRYKRSAQTLKRGLQRLGLEVLQDLNSQWSNVVTLVRIPAETNYLEIVERADQRKITIFTSPDLVAEGIVSLSTMGALSEGDIEHIISELALVFDV